LSALLPILWAEPPTADDWHRLGEARKASGYPDLVKPARALQGSPGRILAIGVKPDWLCDYDLVESTEDPRLDEVLSWCLELTQNPWAPDYAELLSDWFGATVTFLGEEHEQA
jgi:hypothetical protein